MCLVGKKEMLRHRTLKVKLEPFQNLSPSQEQFHCPQWLLVTPHDFTEQEKEV